MHALVHNVADWRKGHETLRVEDVLPRHLSPDLLYENSSRTSRSGLCLYSAF